jgi:hypothetical protein
MSELLIQSTGLVPYDRMCKAIAECKRVDHAKDIKDKARALEIYHHQIQNTEAERACAQIRLRAERKMGALLREMKDTGERDAGRGGKRKPVTGKSKLKDISRSDAPTVKTTQAQAPSTLRDLGLTRDQSSQYQKLADIPEQEFEKALSDPTVMPSTEGIINRSKPTITPPPIEGPARVLWQMLADFERERFTTVDPSKLLGHMTVAMKDDVARIAPVLAKWLSKLASLAA